VRKKYSHWQYLRQEIIVGMVATFILALFIVPMIELNKIGLQHQKIMGASTASK
jgi:hypothetical protein